MTDLTPLSGLTLHHLGIVVTDLDSAIARYQAMGFGEPERFSVPEQLVEAAVFVAGAGYVELIAPTDSASGTAKYLARRGEGMHHIAYAVSDIVAKLAELRDAGFRLIDEQPRTGTHNWQIAFIHPESTHGVLTELVHE